MTEKSNDQINSTTFKTDRKINLLEHRLTGPSKDGNSPIENLSNENIENIKLKLFKTEKSNNTKSNTISNNISNLSSNIHITNAKLNTKKDANICQFLTIKRKKKNDSSFDNNSIMPISEIKNSNLNYLKKNKGKKNEYKNLKLKDYLKSSSSIISSSTDSNNLDNFRENSLGNSDIIQKIKETLSDKIKESNELKKRVTELSKKNQELNHNLIIIQNEIEKSEIDICKFVKENAELKRKIMQKELNEKQYSIGKLTYQKLSNGQILEYFEEGSEFKKIISLMKNINSKRNELKLLNSQQNDLIKFKLNELDIEEKRIKNYETNLQKEKSELINNYCILKEESRCLYLNKWPLLGKKYQLVSLIGKGGYSEVYKAYDIKNHKYVACKIHQLNPNWSDEMKDSYIKHTMRENEILKNIHHKNIINHIDTIEINNNSFCSVLELCNGTDLSNYLRERKILSEKEVKVITKQILEALVYLENLPKKIIHYDLKPQNILFNNLEVKLTDFGLAKIIDSNSNFTDLTSQGTGTYFYLPPECFIIGDNVKINEKVDIWSLGIIVYEMLFGNKPFSNNLSQNKYVKEKIYENMKNLSFENNYNVKISEECKIFLRKCLDVNIEKRYDAIDAMNSSFIKNISLY